MPSPAASRVRLFSVMYKVCVDQQWQHGTCYISQHITRSIPRPVLLPNGGPTTSRGFRETTRRAKSCHNASLLQQMFTKSSHPQSVGPRQNHVSFQHSNPSRHPSQSGHSLLAQLESIMAMVINFKYGKLQKFHYQIPAPNSASDLSFGSGTSPSSTLVAFLFMCNFQQ
jgi:hypothetical protein